MATRSVLAAEAGIQKAFPLLTVVCAFSQRILDVAGPGEEREHRTRPGTSCSLNRPKAGKQVGKMDKFSLIFRQNKMKKILYFSQVDALMRHRILAVTLTS